MKVQLQHDQAQYLITRLSLVAKEGQKVRGQLRKLEGILWNKSDKDSAKGSEYFKNLNLIRTAIRESKEEEAKVNAIIRQLRKVNY